jgi:TRAP transporter TAXI family solute receptor
MTRLNRWLTLVALVALDVHAAAGDTRLRIVTGGERGTLIDVARDLSVLVAPDARVDLEVLPSAGSVDNIRRLRGDRDVRLALVQADVVQAYLDLAAGGDAEAADLIRPLRVVMPLFVEEVYFVARADSPMRYVDDIRGARINLGERGSGSALTAASLYRLLFEAALPAARASHLSSEEALAKLVTDRSVDVVVIVGGQPMRLLEDMRPEARELVKLLRLRGTAGEGASGRYATATVRERHYPNVLDGDVEAFAVRTLLVTSDDGGAPPAARDALVRFAGALCRNLDRLRRHGHPKWREVEPSLPDLGRGWVYHPGTSRALSACIAERVGGADARR